MANLKSLAKDTMIYGMTGMLGRFLNYLLVPLYTYTMVSSEFGNADLILTTITLLAGLQGLNNDIIETEYDRK